MPTKTLTSQAGRTGSQKTFKFGGGANTIFAIDDVVVVVDPDPEIEDFTLGSPYGYIINGGGGNDTIYGSDYSGPPDTLNGGIPDPEFVLETATGDLLIGGNGSDTIFGGEGDDTIYGGNTDGSADISHGPDPATTNILVGDGERVTDGDPTTADPLSADVNFIDGATLFDGGNDTLVGGVGVTLNRMFGDAEDVTMVADSTFNGGNDTLNGGSGTASTTNSMFGDGDIVTMVATSTFNGGNDTLQAGDGSNNTMIGDARDVNDAIVNGGGTIKGGNDTLISGTGNDIMTGDWGSLVDFSGTFSGGIDTFVFLTLDHGFDSIRDFQVGVDKINLWATGLTWALLDSDNSGFVDETDFGVTINGDTTQINLTDVANQSDGSSGDLLTISGVTGLVEADFDFTTDIFA